MEIMEFKMIFLNLTIISRYVFLTNVDLVSDYKSVEVRYRPRSDIFNNNVSFNIII